MGARCLHARRSRIQVELPVWASARQQRELTAFARYCVARLEREVGELDRWTVAATVDPSGGFASTVTAHQGAMTVDASGAGQDGTLAIWDALCNVEQALRERLHGEIAQEPLCAIAPV
ncbi:MAG TPA: hypothetical protein VL463_16200 [Kofleriaceae bacterium]|jgi:hypothetical protein|nr:hypothetical protein [Kofleriaceae bacterium]